MANSHSVSNDLNILHVNVSLKCLILTPNGFLFSCLPYE